MRYRRTELDIEAMPVKDLDGAVLYYLVEWPDGVQTRMENEEFTRHFTKLDHRFAPPKRTRKKKVPTTQENGTARQDVWQSDAIPPPPPAQEAV